MSKKPKIHKTMDDQNVKEECKKSYLQAREQHKESSAASGGYAKAIFSWAAKML